MSKDRRQRSPDFKAQVDLEVLRGIEPVHVSAARHEVHPAQVSEWKKQAAERLPEADAAELKAREKDLFEQIGRLNMELEWLQKNWPARVLSSVGA